MEKEHFKVVIVGHVDHGKSTFIGRLLYDTDSIPLDKIETIEKVCAELNKPLEWAFVTDQIREEREQGITIDTTQIYFHTEQRDYVIIDAPGHKEFMKNMITGASQAEGSALVIDANEGVREQTRRHAYVLSMLGLKENIILLNKMDLIDYSEEIFNSVKSDIMSLCDSLGIPCTYIIPISAQDGDNIATISEKMPWYKGCTVIEALDSLSKREDEDVQPLRMPVQDVYHVDGKKIIVGRIEAGKVAEGDKVLIVPQNEKVTIAGVHEFGRERHSAAYGENIGITIEEPLEVTRGQMISAIDSTPIQTSQIHGNVFWMSPESVKVGEDIVFRCNTQEVPCRISCIRRKVDSSTSELLEENASTLGETEVGEVLLETDHPVAVEIFTDFPELGRFVLEKNADIVAGGVITEDRLGMK